MGQFNYLSLECSYEYRGFIVYRNGENEARFSHECFHLFFKVKYWAHFLQSFDNAKKSTLHTETTGQNIQYCFSIRFAQCGVPNWIVICLFKDKKKAMPKKMLHWNNAKTYVNRYKIILSMNWNKVIKTTINSLSKVKKDPKQ